MLSSFRGWVAAAETRDLRLDRVRAALADSLPTVAWTRHLPSSLVEVQGRLTGLDEELARLIR